MHNNCMGILWYMLLLKEDVSLVNRLLLPLPLPLPLPLLLPFYGPLHPVWDHPGEPAPES